MKLLPGEASFLIDFVSLMQAPGLRSMGEFAEQEIILPSGPFAGRRYRIDRHPAARLWFSELDSGRWQRAFCTGPNQDAKSTIGFVIPTLYKLFERKERVLLGAPSGDIASDKWHGNLLPAIKASRFKDLLPSSGRGSRGGDSIAIEFKHGVMLRFMTAGGGDQSRSHFDTPNLIVTETDGFDEVGATSREGDKFSQLERRTLAYGDQARTIAECTVSIEQGRTWQEYQRGTQSRIAIPCPECRAYVTPEREHLVGWQGADTEVAAIAAAHVVCPNCGAPWTNEQRIEANQRCVLAHRGQTVDENGKTHGAAPETNTLGFRWTVVNSVLSPKRLSLVGGLEWRVKRAADEEMAERDLCQSQWALPSKPQAVDLSKLDAFAIMRRILPKIGRGILPEGTQHITVGCDIGKRLCHWTAIAWRKGATPHVIDYDRIEVPCELMSEEDAIKTALSDWKDEVLDHGWGGMKPTFVFVDAGNWQTTVQQWCIAAGGNFIPTKGFGATQRRIGQSRRDTGAKVIRPGEGYNLVAMPDGTTLLEINTDRWKSWLHARLQTPIDKPGALTLFDSGDGRGGGDNNHLSFAKHNCAERQVEEFVPGTGTVTKWEALSRSNHWGDATVEACVAGHAAGVRLDHDKIDEPAKKQEQGVPVREWLNSGTRY